MQVPDLRHLRVEVFNAKFLKKVLAFKGSEIWLYILHVNQSANILCSFCRACKPAIENPILFIF